MELTNLPLDVAAPQVLQALERGEAQLVVLAEDCDNKEYVELVEVTSRTCNAVLPACAASAPHPPRSPRPAHAIAAACQRAAAFPPL